MTGQVEGKFGMRFRVCYVGGPKIRILVLLHRHYYRAVNPPRLQFRIDREVMIDDVISHGI